MNTPHTFRDEEDPERAWWVDTPADILGPWPTEEEAIVGAMEAEDRYIDTYLLGGRE